MKKLSFDQLESISSYQLISETSGYVLDGQGKLYRFSGKELEPITTPDEFTITHFHFIDETHGAITGTGEPTRENVQTSAVYGEGTGWLVLLLVLLIGLGRIDRRRFAFARKVMSTLLICCLGVGAFSCFSGYKKYISPNPESAYITDLTGVGLGRGRHDYLPNKNMPVYIAFTENGGNGWQLTKAPTSFYPTALASVGGNYLLGTTANDVEGPLVLHQDGDVYIYGQDSLAIPRRGGMAFDKPLVYGASRAVKGIRYYPEQSQIFLFGSERMPSFPLTSTSATDGNIIKLPGMLEGPYQIIDVPNTTATTSLTYSASGLIWVTQENRREVKTKEKNAYGQNLRYEMLKDKQMLCFKRGEWEVQSIDGHTSFEQVEYIPGTRTGYALTHPEGLLYKTTDEGDNWTKLPIEDVRKLQLHHNKLCVLQAANQLVILD